MNHIKSYVALILCFSFVFTTGCASIVHGPTERICFTSDPTGAKLQIAGQETITPACILLNRRGKHVAHFTKEGYETTEFKLKESMSLWFLLGNLGFGGIPGWIIDAINGSIGNLEPDAVHVNLVPK